jgi:hypothetical protein
MEGLTGLYDELFDGLDIVNDGINWPCGQLLQSGINWDHLMVQTRRVKSHSSPSGKVLTE